MKICMLAPEFIPVWGGVGTYTIELLRHLPKTYEVHVITPKRQSFGSDKVQTVSLSKYFKSNVKIHYISSAKDTFNYNAMFQYECFRQVPKILKDEKIDLIHSHAAHMPDLLLMFRKLNTPIITTVHSTIKIQRLATKFSQKSFSNMEKSEQATYITYPCLRFLEELYFKRRRFYISPSNWMKNWLINTSHIYQEIPVIPNSVDLTDYKLERYFSTDEPFTEADFGDKKLILFVGRLLALKGVDILIQAIPNIITRLHSKKVLFVFIGPGDRNRYLKAVKALGIESFCLFTGPASREFVIHLMQHAKILVAPSFIENSPFTILESMACGLPVIANNVGGVSEIVKDGYNGKLLGSNSSKSIEDAIITLLADESLQLSMKKNAIETIEKNFSWKVNLPKYAKVYNNALN
jgi:glycosyltransferase involved in cell wall biosynthesis